MTHSEKATPRQYSMSQRMVALAYGLTCHLLFGAAILSMALGLLTGLRIGFGTFSGWVAPVANVLLLLSFPLLHSWLLSAPGRRLITRLAPLGIGKQLSTTTYSAIASAQLLSVFLLWSPSGIIWWEAHGTAKIVVVGAALASWILLGKSMADAQLSLQTGYVGWSAVFRNQVPRFKRFSTKGLYRHVRQPIYISFTLLLWTSAVWTPDQLVLAILWTGYCVVGSALKERRYLAFSGKAFRDYQAEVPFWIPAFKRRARPAVSGENVQTPSLDADVVIAGAGPVGLLLANLLGMQGRRVLVVESRTAPPQGSLAIGITPPSMAVLKRLGLDDVFARRGVRINTAHVHENQRYLGGVDFSRLPAEHRFILSLPQSTTIQLLRDRLSAFPSVKLVDGVQLAAHTQSGHSVDIQLKDIRSGAFTQVKASFLAGCDGHRSQTRKQAGIRWRQRVYRPRFLMADFSDNTALGKDAHLFFGKEGSVESFPLPDGHRRWIVLADPTAQAPASVRTAVAELVRKRTGHALDGQADGFASTFQPQRALADRYVNGRVVLCGDAAHVMSPIGGQGMNTGFADAAHLARVLHAALADSRAAGPDFAHYERARRRAFNMAATRAARGMWMGTRTGRVYSGARAFFIRRFLLGPTMRERVAPYFAMLTLPDSPIAPRQAIPTKATA